jgi:hypothetical protein
MTAPNFKIYYDDGTTFEGDPMDAPQTGVQVIAGWGEQRYLAHSRDYYVWRSGRFDAADIGGFWDYLLMHKGPRIVLFGRTMAREDDYWATVSRADKERPD